MHYTRTKCLLFILLFVLTAGASAQQRSMKLYFQESADSLKQLLAKTPASNGERKLELLNHLSDIGLETGDTAYIMPCWHQAVLVKDVNVLDDISLSMAMRYQRKGMQDSIEVWKKRMEKHIPQPRLTENLEYLHLMKDIQNWQELKNLAKGLIQERVKLDARKEPYHAMRVLYTLGIISCFETLGNDSLNLKSSTEYMDEALQIARKLPFRESCHFRRQILLGLSPDSIDYARQYLEFNRRFMDEPDMRGRKFYSRRAIMSAYEKLLVKGDRLPRQELDGYYEKLQQLMKDYPQDALVDIRFFSPRVHYEYCKATGNDEKALFWCDSLIRISRDFNREPSFYMRDRMHMLGKLKRWEEGYATAIDYMQLRDSLNNASNQQQLAELQTQYDVEHLRLEKEKEQLRLLCAVIGCGLLLVLVGFLLYHNRLVRRKNLALCAQLEEYARTLKSERELKKSVEKEAVEKKSEADTGAVAEAEAASDEKYSALFAQLEHLMHEERFFAEFTAGRTEVCTRLGINKNKLSDVLQANTGMTFGDYLTDIRLQEAILLMDQHPDMPITEIGEKVGYINYNTFYRAFYKKFQVKPTAYREYLAR